MSDFYGLGAEYGAEAQRHWWRESFLDDVADVEPRVLGVLRDDVLPAYRDAGRNAKAVDTALNRWAESFHLSCDWVREAAVRTLDDWAATSWRPGQKPQGMRIGNWPDDDDGALRWAQSPLDFPRVEPPAPPAFRLPPWEPTLQTWADYSDAIRWRLDHWLERYRERAERWSEAEGMNPRRRRLASHRGRPTQHFRWLAHWQCSGWSMKRIASEYDRKRPTVRDGIKTAGELIDLPVRRGRPGRPPEA